MPDFHQEMVNSAMEVREEKYILKRRIKMKILPEFKWMFNDKKEVSSKYQNLEETADFINLSGTPIKEDWVEWKRKLYKSRTRKSRMN